MLEQMESLFDDSHLDVLDMDTRLTKRGAAQLAPSVTKIIEYAIEYWCAFKWLETR